MTIQFSLLHPDGSRRRGQIVIQTAIIGLIFLASAWLIPNASTRAVVFLLLGIPALGAALFLLRRPQWGLVLLIPVALVVPVQVGTGTGSAINAPMLLVGGLTAIWLVDMLILRRDLRLHRSRPLLPLFGLLVAVGLAFLAGRLPWLPIPGAPLRAQLGGVSLFVLSAAAFLLVAHQVDDLKWLRRMVWTFLALGGFYMAGRLLPGTYGYYIVRLYPVGASGSLFWVWLTALAGGQLFFNARLKGRWRLALALLLAATLYVGLTNFGWKSGWLPPLAGLAALLWLGAARLRIWVLLATGLAAAPFVDNVVQALIAGEFYSWTTRLEAWRIVLKLARLDPIFGLGPANYYWYTPLIAILGWNVQFNSHNQYVDLVAQVGVVGLFFYLWFFWAMLRLAWRLHTQVPAGFARGYVYGVFGGLVGMLVAGMLGDWVIPFVYNIGLAGFRSSVLGWVFMGGLVALDIVIKQT